jgi:uncharacterized protein involved in type VI secretion and phage assembly
VLFNRADSARQNAAGTVRYHRDSATEERDSITSWSAVRTLQPGSTASHSWDYRNPLGAHFMDTRGYDHLGSYNNPDMLYLTQHLIAKLVQKA